MTKTYDYIGLFFARFLEWWGHHVLLDILRNHTLGSLLARLGGDHFGVDGLSC